MQPPEYAFALSSLSVGSYYSIDLNECLTNGHWTRICLRHVSWTCTFSWMYFWIFITKSYICRWRRKKLLICEYDQEIYSHCLLATCNLIFTKVEWLIISILRSNANTYKIIQCYKGIRLRKNIVITSNVVYPMKYILHILKLKTLSF